MIEARMRAWLLPRLCSVIRMNNASASLNR